MTTVNADTSNFAPWIFPALFVAMEVVIKNVWVDGYKISDVVTLTDIGVNVGAYYLAEVITEFGIDKMFDQTSGSGKTLAQSGTDIVIEPVIQGLLCGLVRPMIHSTRTLVSHPITFTSSFIDGFSYNIIAKYLSSPIVYYFENN